MPINFNFLESKKQYALFSEQCIAAEKVLSTSLVLSILGSYDALKLAVKWVYAVENIPIVDIGLRTFEDLINDPLFKSLIDEKIYFKLPYIIKLSKFTLASDDDVITKDDAVLALSILFEFITWIDYIYGLNYTERVFREEDIPMNVLSIDKNKIFEQKCLVYKDPNEIKTIQKELMTVGKYIISKKDVNQKNRKFTPINFNKIEIREHFIDLDLKFAGWDLERDVKKGVEYVIGNMADGREKVAIDYILLGKDGLPLAIIEGRYSLENLNYGKTRAVKYAAHIGNDMRRVPIIFLVNGGSMYIMEDLNSEPRAISGIFNLEDLHRLKNQSRSRKNLITVSVDTRIANAKYKVDAVRSIIKDFENGKRKSLIFMTDGSDKLRVYTSVIDLMSRANYITNVLFLTSRESTLKYEKKLLKHFLLGVSVGEHSETMDENTQLVITTNDKILKDIGNIAGTNKKYFSPGQFDLIIVDEVYRNTIVAYSEIFRYFDGFVIGISSLPKEDLDKKIFDFFDTTKDDISYIYHYEEALQKEKIIVPYNVVSIGGKVLENGVFYDQLTGINRNLCEETYSDDPIKMQNWVPSPLINEYLMSPLAIDTMLYDIMKIGIKDSKSENIGKTVIFAQNKMHGEIILKRFRIKYPKYDPDFIKIAYSDDKDGLDDFLDPNKNTNLLIDVGFSTIGMDIPEILNVVLLKKIYSKFEFYKMISIGNRQCNSLTCIDQKEGLYTGKRRYYIFDYLGNFEFFNENKNGINGLEIKNTSEEVFSKAVEIIYALQNNSFTDVKYQDLCNKLITFVMEQVQNVSQELINVQLQLTNIDKYCMDSTYLPMLKSSDKDILVEQIAPLVRIKGDEHKLQFDNFMYSLMLSQIESTPFFLKAKKQLANICNMLIKSENIPEIKSQWDYIKYYGSTKFLESSTVIDIEQARIKLRDLIKYIFGTYKDDDKNKSNDTAQSDSGKNHSNKHSTVQEKSNDDNISGGSTSGEQITSDDPQLIKIEEYKKKIKNYIFNEGYYQAALYRVRNNMLITYLDNRALEKMFTKKLGTKEDYKKAYGDAPFARTVRSIMPMESESMKVAFFNMTNDKTLSTEQKQFLNNLIKYMVEHGFMEEPNITITKINELSEFTKLFDTERQKKILDIIRGINENALHTI